MFTDTFLLFLRPSLWSHLRIATKYNSFTKCLTKTTKCYVTILSSPSGHKLLNYTVGKTIGVPRSFFGEGGCYVRILAGGEEGGVQQIQLRTEGRENGNMGVVPP
jgi:hypothetical protein